MTVISTAFAPLAQVSGVGAGQSALPLVVVPHPVGDPDENRIAQRGRDIVAACVHALTTPADALTREYAALQFPLPAAVMPR